MLTDSGKLATPRRIKPMQALSGLFRTPTRLHTPTPVTVNRCNKRARARASSITSSIPSTPDTPSLPAVVLQTYSVSTDSIVLTALPTVPFCCHEDLLTMSRAQLEAVVRALNTRLPSRMRICPEDDFWQNGLQDSIDGEDDGVSRMSEVELRRRIEELVGIRPIVGKNRVSRLGLGLDASGRVPPAPKAVRTRNAAWRPSAKTPWEMEVDGAEDQAEELSNMFDETLMGSSPLASRTKSSAYMRGRSSTLSLLPILQEENEGNESKEDDEGRPFKRQRVLVTQGINQILQVTRESRLVENMDLSASPLLAEEDDARSYDFPEVVRAARSPFSGAMPSEEIERIPPQRRRSARIKEIALKRASSFDAGKNVPFNAKDLKSTILRSRTFSSRDSPASGSSLGEFDERKRFNTPREIAVRLPFTSTPPHQKLESSVFSAPRILCSNSQRLFNTNKLTLTRTRLGRSRSERYPRTSDLAFVTIDRPRYRFSERRSSETEITQGGQELHPFPSVSPAQVGDQPQQDPRFGIEHPSVKSQSRRKDGDPDEASKSFTIGGHRISTGTLPSALYNLLSPRSRALSTSTVASICSHTGESPMHEGTKRTADMAPARNDGPTERIWETLGRMVVDSREGGLSKEC